MSKQKQSDKWWNLPLNEIQGCPDDGGCECADICWARNMAHRFLWKERLNVDFERITYKSLPIPKGKDKVIFANNTSDLWHPLVENYMRLVVWRKMLDNPQHIFVNLTKRPNIMAEFLNFSNFSFCTEDHFWMQKSNHIWQGVSVTSQETMWRLDVLRNQIPLNNKLVSLEPLRSPVTLDLDGIRWVIVGPDSSKTWPCEAEWVIDIVEQCQSAKVPVFVKGVKYLKNYSAPSSDITSNLVDITPMVRRALVLNTQEYPIWK